MVEHRVFFNVLIAIAVKISSRHHTCLQIGMRRHINVPGFSRARDMLYMLGLACLSCRK